MGRRRISESRIGIGLTIVFGFGTYISGGHWFGYLGVCVGLLLIVHVLAPNLFVKHLPERKIAGVPARNATRWGTWILSAIICVGLAFTAPGLHRRFLPDKPELGNVIKNGFRDITAKLDAILTLLQKKPASNPSEDAVARAVDEALQRRFPQGAIGKESCLESTDVSISFRPDFPEETKRLFAT